MGSSKQIRLGAVMSYVAIGFNSIAGLIYTPWMIHKIGRADYGLYTLATSLLAYFMMDFGVGSALARFIAKYRAEGNEAQVRQLLGLTAKMFLALDFLFLLAVVVLYFFVPGIFAKLEPPELAKFKVIYCIVGFFSVIKFPFLPLNGVFVGYEQFVFLKVADLIRKMLTVVLMVLALTLGYGLYALVLVNALVGLLIIAVQCAFLFWKAAVRVSWRHFDRNLLREIFSFSVWVTLVLLAQRLFVNIAPTILGVFSGTKEIAVFAVGMTVEGYFYMLTNAVGGFFLPRISRMMAANDHAAIEQLLARNGRLQLLLMGAILITFAALGREFIPLWVGRDFARSYFVALLLMIPDLIVSSQQIAYMTLHAQNKVKYHALSLLCTSPISVVMSILLSRVWGAVGAALGICIALLVCHVTMNIVFRRQLRLDVWRFFMTCHCRLLPVFGLSLGVIWGLGMLVPAKSLLIFVPKAGMLTGLHAVLMWVLAMNVYEKDFVKSLAGKVWARTAKNTNGGALG